MRIAFALLLFAHGVAHLAGFVSSWKLATLAELPYRTTILAGRVDVGDAGIRVVGALWLLAALAFMVTAIGVGLSATWAGRAALAATVGSIALCVVGWPDARLGIVVNVAVLLALALGTRR
jgi:hypothetical protein